MNLLCDLHTHSTFSDGTLSPSQLVSLAVQQGLGALALTDHNTLAGLPGFRAAAQGQPLQAIAGVEISSGFAGREVHILGLFLTENMEGPLNSLFQQILERKDASNRSLVRRLQQAGYRLDYDAICAQHPGTVNRAVMATHLLESGQITSIQAAIQGILAPGQGYYIPPERTPALEIIGLLHRIGAVPVLAHPYLSLDPDTLADFLPLARQQGLAAMETRYSTYSPATAAAAKALAEKTGLLESGGSDFHGSNKPGLSLGRGYGNLAVPMAFAKNLAAWAAGSSGSPLHWTPGEIP